ncbi:YadA-like family protein [Photobacterium phosphoreum]|uniref:YadA-like family protein n=1 Tax=Photobacterium phosphoreum TaxID=659 RepID=UPI001009C13C|nr:YadA-like family protein [Photobacterium phosphoreum]
MKDLVVLISGLLISSAAMAATGEINPATATTAGNATVINNNSESIKSLNVMRGEDHASIQKDMKDINTNAKASAANKASSDTNAAGVADNHAGLVVAKAAIDTNTGNIATNTGNIATNTKDIKSNTDAISNLANSTNQRFSKVNNRIDATQAMTQAVVNARPMVTGDKTAIGVGAGFAGSSQAISIGLAHGFGNGWSSSTTIAQTTGATTDFSGGVGAQYAF